MILAVAPLSLSAQVSVNVVHPVAPAWSGNGQLALSQRSASVNSLNVALGHTLNYERGGRAFDLSTTYNYLQFQYEATRRNGSFAKRTTRTNSADAASHYKVAFAGRNYWILLAQLDIDRAQGISHRSNGATGVGRNLVRTQRGASLQVEAVGGYLNEKQTDGTEFNYPTVGGGLNLTLPLGATGRLTSVNSGFGDTGGRGDWLFRSRNSLSAQINRVFGIAVNFNLTDDTKPSLAFFDPTGEGEVSLSPTRRVTDISASLTMRW